MRRLELDFLRRSPRPGWAAWALLLIAVAFVAEVGWSWRQLSMQVERKEAQLASLTGKPRNADILRIADRPPREGELDAARDTLKRLSVPWNTLFGALEAAQTDHTWLLSIEPNAQSGTVTLSGEARDYLAALSYVANLEQQKALSRVHLAKHETRSNDPQRTLAFVISASWKERP
ncbi:MAG: PilN domain-containing protein [Burkholderiales bacterium]